MRRNNLVSYYCVLLQNVDDVIHDEDYELKAFPNICKRAGDLIMFVGYVSMKFS